MDDRAGSAADSWTGDPVDSGAVRSRPRGFAVRAHPHDSPALWAAIGALGPDRYGVTVGHCADPRRSAADRDRALARLREDPDPAAALAGVSPAECTAVCAVIDPTAATLRYSTVGEAGVTLVAPEGTATALPPSPGVMSTPSAIRKVATAGGRREGAQGLRDGVGMMVASMLESTGGLLTILAPLVAVPVTVITFALVSSSV